MKIKQHNRRSLPHGTRFHRQTEMAAPRRLFAALLVTNALLAFTVPSFSRTSAPVTVSLYYETLCPYCANFIVNSLVQIFQNGLASVVNLRMVPWGNAWIQSDGSFVCQHGSDECLLNTIEACAITVYPDVGQHFRFIHCVERFALAGNHSMWIYCFQMSGLGTVPIDCYNSGNGNVIEQKYARETAQLVPHHRFVPWVVVDNQALQEDYGNFMYYICKAYRGHPKPEACRSISPETADSAFSVCFAEEGRNLTSLTPATKNPRLTKASETPQGRG